MPKPPGAVELAILRCVNHQRHGEPTMARTASTSTTRLHRQPARGRGRRLAARLPVTVLLIVASCSTGSGPDANDRAIAIYSVVIRTVLTQPPGGQPAIRAHDTSVFVAAADTHSPISLEVQAGVADTLHNVAPSDSSTRDPKRSTQPTPANRSSTAASSSRSARSPPGVGPSASTRNATNKPTSPRATRSTSIAPARRGHSHVH